MDKTELIELLSKYSHDAQKKLNDDVVATAGTVLGTSLDKAFASLMELSETLEGVIRTINTETSGMANLLDATSKNYYSYGVLAPPRYGSVREDVMRRLCDCVRRTDSYKKQNREIKDKFDDAIRKVNSMRNPDKILALAKEMGIVVDTVTMPGAPAGVDTGFIKETINKVKALA